MEKIKIQPQSGLGDLINALPLIEYLGGAEVATNHHYALEPFVSMVDFVPVEMNGSKPVIRDGFRHLKYRRYGASRYRDEYFHAEGYEIYANCVRERYKAFYKREEVDHNFVVFAPPRAAARHKKKGSFECAPDVDSAYDYVRSLDMPLFLVGNNDLYPDHLPKAGRDVFDLRDETTFPELCWLIMSADRVVSQVSAISTLAGLFGKPTKFLKAASETVEEHKKHVAGVVWPGQEVL